jgi:hypothetical protein
MTRRIRSHLAVAVATAVATAAAFAIPALADDPGADSQPAPVEAATTEAVPAETVDAGNAGEATGGGSGCGWVEAEAVPFEPGDGGNSAEVEAVPLEPADDADQGEVGTLDLADGGEATNAQGAADAGDDAKADDPVEGVATLCAVSEVDGNQIAGTLATTKAESIDCESAKP